MDQRKIIHIDMDAFFASIEQRDHPEWQGRPLAVGSPTPRSVIAAASYEARRYGVCSAMPALTAMRLCPHLVFALPRFEVYGQVSRQIMQIFREYTDLVEPLSLDEAFLDVTTCYRGTMTATQIAQEIKNKIKEQTGLTASAGVSYNKFLAKIASDYRKPDGLYVIRPSEGEAFVAQLPIERFFGVGRATLVRMHELGIKTGLDLRSMGAEALVHYFGRRGLELYQNAFGVDLRPVVAHYERQSIGTEVTLKADTCDREILFGVLDDLAQELLERLESKHFEGNTLTLKVKYADFRVRSRSRTLAYPLVSFEEVKLIGRELLARVDLAHPVRLIGLSIKQSRTKSRRLTYIQPTFPFF